MPSPHLSTAPLKTILSSNVVTVPPDTDILKVLALMEEKKISSVVAVDRFNRAQGIFTEQDAVKLLLKTHDLTTVTMADAMSSPLLTVPPNLGYSAAYQLMSQHGYRHLVVIDPEGKLIGLVSEGDFMHHMGMEYLVELKTVASAMTREVKTLDQRHCLQDALSLMTEYKISCVVITDHKKPIGVITERDIVRLSQLDIDIEQYPLSKQISKPLITTQLQQPIQHAARTMETNHIRRLIVVNEDGELQGLLSRHDIACALQGCYIEYLQETIQRTHKELSLTQQKLRTLEQHALYKGLLDELSDAIYIIDADSGLIIDANGQMCRNLGYSYDEMLDLHITDFSLLAANACCWQQKISDLSQQESTLRECHHQRKDGSTYPAEVKIRFIEHQGQSFFLAIARDITERIHSMEQIQASADTYRGVIDTALDGFIMTDLNGQLLDVNDSYIRMSQFSRDQLLTMNLAELQRQDHPNQTLNHLRNIQNHGGQCFTTVHQRQLGNDYDVEVNINFWPGLGGRFFIFLRDITVRKENDDRLRQAAAVFESSNEGVIVTDPYGTIQLVNNAFSTLTGYSREEAIGQNSKLLQSGRHDDEFYRSMWQQIEQKGNWQGEIWNRRKDGTVYPELLSISSVRDELNTLTHYVGVFADLSLLKESEEKLSYLAHHDMLTGLTNRLMMQAQLQHAINTSERHNRKAALLLLDLDRFKDINDSFGHTAGDEVLCYVSDSLRKSIGRSDTVCRFGGDEFAVLLEEIDHPEDIVQVANNLIDKLSQSITLSNKANVQIGTSIGISIYPDHGDTPEKLMQNADAALYRAKSEGRGRFEYYSEALTRDARHRLNLEAELRYALANNELHTYFQPQVETQTGRIVGAESLIRWLHPEKGMISPAEFIPLAERTGLISDIGLLVLKQTCKQGRYWIDKGWDDLTLAVNVSARQFTQGNLAEEITSILLETDYPAAQLELELTESALMERESDAVELLSGLRELGVRLAIDDFGTGYSSLAYLKRFPLDVLKIDKSFVDDIPNDPEGTEIAATIIAMGQALGFEVLAEGVEDQQQLEFLQQKNCGYYQGYLTSPAVPAEQFSKLLEQNRDV